MTVRFYQCRGCSAFCEYYKTSCDWCSSPFREIILTGDKSEIIEVPVSPSSLEGKVIRNISGVPPELAKLIKENWEKAHGKNKSWSDQVKDICGEIDEALENL
jgi:hypothetical protein